MTKLYRVAFVALLCAASLYTGSAAWACTFRCISGFTTAINGGPSDWGMGSSCTAAQSALTAALFDRADANCYNRNYDGVCGTVTQVTTTACYFNGTMFQIDAYANHSCGRTICIDPIDPYQ